MYAMIYYDRKCPTDLDLLHQKKMWVTASDCDYIPISTATVDWTFSALQRIKTYARNTTGQSRLAALASMANSIEVSFNIIVSLQFH